MENFKQYLDALGITGALYSKVEEAYAFFTKYLNQKIEDMFVTEYINLEGARVYENLWFFNSDYCFEAKLFIAQDDFDSCVLKRNVEYFEVKKIDFDIVGNLSNDNSRMTLGIRYKNSNIGGELKASKDNCRQLSMILKKYIQPNQNVG